MFESKRSRIRKFLEGKDFQSVDEIALGAEIGRTKTKDTLAGMKNELEEQDGKFKLISKTLFHPTAEVASGSPPILNSETLATQPPTYVLPLPDATVQSHGLGAKMDELEKKLNIVIGLKEQKEKKAKLKKFSLGKLKRYNKGKNRAVILLKSDQTAKLIKSEYIEGNIGLIKISQNYYQGEIQYVWLWEGKQPFFLICEWSLKPISVDMLNKKVDENKCGISSQIVNLRAIQLMELDKEEGKGKSKMNPMIWIGIAIAGVVLGFVFFGGKK